MTNRTWSTLIVVVALAFGMAACETEPATDDMAADTTEAMPPPAAALPDTTDAAVWAYLQGEDYTSWPLFPNTTELYQGNDPHGALLTTYVNDAALQALNGGMAGNMPDGAIIVKENYMPDSTLAAVTVMYKVAGYDADHQDWVWGKYDAAGAAEVFGRAAACQACHNSEGDGNFVVTGDF